MLVSSSSMRNDCNFSVSSVVATRGDLYMVGSIDRVIIRLRVKYKNCVIE